MTDLHWA